MTRYFPLFLLLFAAPVVAQTTPESAEAAVAAQTAIVADVESALTSLAAQRDVLATDLTAAQNDVSRLQANLNAITEQSVETIAAYQDSLAVKETEVAGLTTDLENLRTEIDAQVTAAVETAVASAVAESQVTIDEQQATITDYEGRFAQIQNEVQDNNSRLARIIEPYLPGQ